MCRFFIAFVTFCLCVSGPAGAQLGVDAYLQGLDLLETGKFDEAANQFEKAIEEDDENADYRIALGVALTLGEKLPEAEKALARAIKLSNNADEARLWMATAVAMQGDFTRGTDYYAFAIARNEYVNSLRRMSHEYGQAAFALETARRNGNNQWDVEYANQQLALRDTLRPGFPKFGKAFSEKMKAKLPVGQRPAAPRTDDDSANQQAVSDALLARVKANVDQRDYVAALRDINPLLAGNARDPQLLVYHGLCMLHLDAPEIARRQFTRALYTWPLNGDLYAWRAVAAARTGDQRRAMIDLETAKSLGTEHVQNAALDVAVAPPILSEPAPILNALYESAKAGESYALLIDRASSLIRAQNNRRLRLDEDYVDRLREHQKAVNDNPKDAARLADFAAFLYDNAVSPRGEAVELRAAWRPYRNVDEAMVKAELGRALNIANEALAIDSENVSAMITKAAVLVHQMQFGDAEQFLNQAVAKAPTEPRLLRLFAEVADRAAAAKQAQANSLRAPTTWEDHLYIYTRYPSAAERAQADALEAHANRLWTVARNALMQAIAQAKSPAEGAYFQAVLDRRDGRREAALVSARKATELEPTNLEYLDMVTTLLAETGQKVEALLNQARATNHIHSTAGPVLKCVWFSLPRTKFRTSREYLEQAMKYDPADPRIAAYFGAVAGADERTEVAAAWYAVAAALYEANARFEGVSVDSKEPAPLRIDVAATMMNVNLRAIAVLRTARPQDAEALARANLAIEPRINPADLFTPVPAAMLPDMNADQIPVPQADHAGYMLSVTRLELGKVLIEQKRYDDAIAQLEQVASYRDKVPPTVDANATKMQYPIASARVYIVSALLAKGDTAKAAEQFRYIGRPAGLDAESQAELQRISTIVQQRRADEWQLQEDAAMQQRQQQIDETNRRRRGSNR